MTTFISLKTIKYLHILLSFLIFIACQTTSEIRSSGQTSRSTSPNQVVNQFSVQGHYIDSDQIHSLQLHRAGSPGSAPIINMDSPQQLELIFEVLDFDSRQYNVTFTHHNPDWNRSGLPEEFFIDGVYTHHLDSGRVSRVQRPDYRQFNFRFPNNRLQFTKSGNYMIHVVDQDTRRPVLSLPFFISENEGSVHSFVEEMTTPRQNLRVTHRPVSRYTLPDFVEQPIFDLEFYYTQNQFWGRAVRAQELDFSDPAEVQFEIDSRNRFIGDYEFLTLSLTNMSQTNPQIFEAQPDEIPPILYLSDDISGFASARRGMSGRFGRPNNNLNGQYANVVFTFDPSTDIQSNQQIYLVGDFNNWTIHSNNRLIRNESLNRWQTNATIKEGVYNYKYVLLERNEIYDLFFDDLFGGTQQEYHAFVYMRDSREFYYRLIQVNRFLFSD